MEDLRQKGYDEEEIYGEDMNVASPNEPHLACVLLLDTSGSMAGDSIDSLNKAINDFKKKTAMDEFAQKRVDIAVIEFNDTARLVQDFTPLPQFQPINLTAGGLTAMGEGINLAIDKVKERNRLYNDMGTPCFTSWIFMISDRATTDGLSARQRIIEEENKKRLKFWAIKVSKLVELVSKTLEWICLEDDLAPNFDEFDLYLYKPEKSIPSDW